MKPAFSRKKITKDQYKEILRKAVPKVFFLITFLDMFRDLRGNEYNTCWVVPYIYLTHIFMSLVHHMLLFIDLQEWRDKSVKDQPSCFRLYQEICPPEQETGWWQGGQVCRSRSTRPTKLWRLFVLIYNCKEFCKVYNTSPLYKGCVAIWCIFYNTLHSFFYSQVFKLRN